MDKSQFRILVADDDAMVRDVIVKFLLEQGYDFLTANEGLETPWPLSFEEVHLVLSDLRMPGADGIEVLRTATRINPKIAVIVITAHGTLDTTLQTFSGGAHDYIGKPFVLQQLLLVVRNAYNLSLLHRENDRLLSRLRDSRRKREEAKTDKAGVPNAMPMDALVRIENWRISTSSIPMRQGF